MSIDATFPFPAPGTLFETLGEFLDRDEVQPRGGLRLETVTVDMPFEISVETDAHGGVQIGASPPTQIVETTLMPVWHRMRLTIGAIEALDKERTSEHDEGILDPEEYAADG